MRVTLSPHDTLPPRRRRSFSRKNEGSLNRRHDHHGPVKRWRRIVPEADCADGALCHVKQVSLCGCTKNYRIFLSVFLILYCFFQYESRCTVNSSTLILCPTPAVGPEARRARVKVHFLLDSLHFDFSAVGNEAFSYEPNPELYLLNRNDPSKPYHHKPGSIISVEVGTSNQMVFHSHFQTCFLVNINFSIKCLQFYLEESCCILQGENLDLAIHKHEVEAWIGDGLCSVKTLTHNHLYCEPPAKQPSVMAGKKQDGMDSLPEFTVSK